MRGAGTSYRERQFVWVHCMECGEEMVLDFLAVHLQIQHGKEMGGRQHWVTTPPGGESCTYMMPPPTTGRPRNCPVEGCIGRAAIRTAMQVHLFHWHVQDTVIILEEGNIPHK